GFGMPDASLLRGAMWPAVRDTVSDGASLVGWVDPGRVRGFVEGFGHGAHEDSRAIWRLYALALWRRGIRGLRPHPDTVLHRTPAVSGAVAGELWIFSRGEGR